jgi:hypothetical protein
VFTVYLKDIAVWRASFHPLMQSAKALSLALADLLVFAVLQPLAADLQCADEPRG